MIPRSTLVSGTEGVFVREEDMEGDLQENPIASFQGRYLSAADAGRRW